MPADSARALFGWADLNTALLDQRLCPPRFKLEKGGKDVGRPVFRERRNRRGQLLHDIDVEALYARLRDGATLILDAVNELNTPLRRLNAGLADEFCASCQTNLYACWGESQGFDIHWDDHDVFVVQLEGRKRWALYGVTRQAPLRRDTSRPHIRPSQVLDEFILEPGDVLYLPRGYWHAAVGLGEPSLHLTLGVSRRTGADFLQWVASQAMAETLVRADMPLECDDERLGEHVAAVLRRTLQDLDPVDLGRRYRRSVEAGRSHRPQLSFPDIGRDQDAPAAGAMIVVTNGAAKAETTDDGAFVLQHRGVRYTLAPSLKSAVTQLVSGEPMSLDQFASRCDATRPQVDAFVRDMLRRGVFAIDGA